MNFFIFQNMFIHFHFHHTQKSWGQKSTYKYKIADKVSTDWVSGVMG